MTSAPPSRKPYRKAPPQHREVRHAAAPMPTLAPQTQAPDGSQARSESDSVSGLSSLEFAIDDPPREYFRARWCQDCRRGVVAKRQDHRRAAVAPKGILKKAECPAVARTCHIIRKSTSAELLDAGAKWGARYLPTPSLDRKQSVRSSSGSFLPRLAWRMRLLEEKLGRKASRQRTGPRLGGKCLPDGACAERMRRWDTWSAALKRAERAGHVKSKVNQGDTGGRPRAKQDVVSHVKDLLSDSDRIRILQQQNEDLCRSLSLSAHKLESAEAEFDGSRHYMEAELSRSRDDLDKMSDKFRRLQNSYTASQRANQDLEEKLHALLRTLERDKKTMDGEMVELTNKLLEAKNTIDRLEELNERYRLDCNLAVQLLKCNKSHFRNHKFADLPCELQDMLKKHMKSSSLPEPSLGPCGQDPDTLSLTPSDVVPTSVIARVLEKPEPLLLNSAQSSSRGWPTAEDVFVHVDMTAEGPGTENDTVLDGSCQSVLDAGQEAGAAPSFDKLNPYPPPPNPLNPGRKVIEFSSDDKVKIPKNSPLPNCTYATRQAISLSLHSEQPLVPPSPAPSRSEPQHHGAIAADTPSSQSSPFSSPPQAPSVGASSASSSEDLLANWQRMFVDKMAPSAMVGGGSSRVAYSDGEEGSTASHASSLDTDTDVEPRSYTRGPYGGGQRLLINTDQDGVALGAQRDQDNDAEEPNSLVRDLSVISPRLLDFEPAFAAAVLPRPHRSPKRMGVHHLHRQQQ
ncbi:tight junction-associated protein 1 isoform X2 [Syngnathus typhle]|uniref:tight junction-associated protein 1 isoform X2 n=1 Tax=Syngnathus typhle TaxID=161592 RepID=UPI002A6B2635|nr:tight junction-associated protein 1 isoform X2 [Syngnathus typhle]